MTRCVAYKVVFGSWAVTVVVPDASGARLVELARLALAEHWGHDEHAVHVASTAVLSTVESLGDVYMDERVKAGA